MDVEISEIQATVRAVDGRSLVSDEIVKSIVKLVLRAVDDKLAHEKRVSAERKVTDGVSKERDEE